MADKISKCSKYIEWLLHHWDTPNDAFHIVNAQIGRCLSLYSGDLPIEKARKVKDTNIHGLNTENQEWSVKKT